MKLEGEGRFRSDLENRLLYRNAELPKSTLYAKVKGPQ